MLPLSPFSEVKFNHNLCADVMTSFVKPMATVVLCVFIVFSLDPTVPVSDDHNEDIK